jgi:hypothetical protein
MIGGIKQSLMMSYQKSHKGIARARVHARDRHEDCVKIASIDWDDFSIVRDI